MSISWQFLRSNVQPGANGRDRLVSYSYNEAGDFSGITDALGQTTHIGYEEHRMVRKTDRNGYTFYWEYKKIHGEYRCTHTWGDNGVFEGWIEYHQGYNLVTNTKGGVTRYDFTPEGYVTSETDPLGNTTLTHYTPEMDIWRVIGPTGNITGYAYDAHGLVTEITYPDGNSQRYAYDAQGHLLLIVSPEGRSMTFTHENGLLRYANPPDNTVVTYGYDRGNMLTSILSPGREYALSYDEYGNLHEVTLNGVAQERWWYDDYGHPVLSENGEQRIRKWEYDALGRMVRDILPDGNAVELGYDAYGNVVKAKDRQRQVSFTYTPLGSLKTREEAGKRITFFYNKDEELTGVLNEAKERYTFGRDLAGRVVMETGFDGILRRYVRTPSGEVSEVIRPEGKTDRYLYNRLGQIARVEHFDDSWQAYSYDKDGLLTEARNAHSHVRMERDKRGQVVREIQDGHVVESRYNKSGERMHVGSSLGADIRLCYDKSGYLSRVDALHQEDSPWQMQLSHNGIGQETERLLTGGVTSGWKYNLHGRVEAHILQSCGRTTRRMEYRWAAGDRLLHVYDALTDKETSFTYDNTGTLTGATCPDGTTVFRVADAVGNLYRSAGRTDRKYGAGGRLLETEGTRYHYDEAGNLTEKNRGNGKNWKYLWNASGMLKRVIRPDFKTVDFEYDALGRRTSKVFGGTVTRWVWDGNTPLHEWQYPLSAHPKIVTDEFGFEYKDREEPVENLTTWVFEEGTFKPAAKLTKEKQYSIITDYLGTPVQMYDEGGTLSWDCSLDIYGKVNTFTGRSLNECPFRYQGQYEDEETGLYYNRFRYYSPEEGVYISQDPIGLDGGSYLYSYVQNTNGWVDIFGLHKNQHLANSNHPVTNVPFDSQGYPNFSGHLYQGGKNDVQIVPTGSRSKDFRAANEAAEYKKPPKGYTWHHHQDNGRMQLVKSKIHSKTGHAGGFSKNKPKAKKCP